MKTGETEDEAMLFNVSTRKGILGAKQCERSFVWGTKDKLIHSLLGKRPLWAETVIRSHSELP